MPVLAQGVEVIGQVPGSGYREPPALVRRADGQTIQLTRLLHLVLAAVDGQRTYAQIADLVSSAFGRAVSPDDVHTLCDSKLRPLGVLQLADGSQPQVKRSNPLLALKFRYVVSNPDLTRRITAPFAQLFNPFVVVAVLLAFGAVSGWVLLEKGLASATHQAFDQPGLLLAVFALTVVSAGFHEFGHAAAARYGGATPGAMGTGLYLVWPAFYTDVTDSYRLGRGGRVRTDLGGLYFNAIVAVAMFGAWWLSGWDALLLIIATQVLQMVRQLLPLVRFDGYHVLADLTGVPDLYHRIKPTLLGLLPGRWHDPEAKALKPWARAVVTIWVLVVVPLLMASLVLMVLALPRLLGSAAAGLGKQWQLMGEQFADGDLLAVIVRMLSILAIVLPVLGVGYILARVVRQLAMATVTWTQGRLVRRVVAGLVAAAIFAGLAWAWWPQPGAYRPVQAYERGTLQDALPAASASTALHEGRSGRANTLWPTASRLPTVQEPELALVLVPRKGLADPAAPTWVFPFNRPDAPGAGDNQALAVNTIDGSTQYDVAFALVWADGSTVVNRNEAYALARCASCTTVAVAFQVVLIVGAADIVMPRNISAAVNYSCKQCVTSALATQLVLRLSGPLSQASDAELAAVWKEIAAFSKSVKGVPFSELQRRLTAYERRIVQIIRADPAAKLATAATTSPTTAPTSGSTSTTGAGGSTSSRNGATPSGPTASSPTPDTSSPDTSTLAPPSVATTSPTSSATATDTSTPSRTTVP